LFHLRLYRRIHLDERRPGAFEAFAGEFFRRDNAQLPAAGDFAGGVVEHVGRAFGEEAVALHFDVPTGQNAQRERLRRYLRDNGFGYLHNSVWITPDPLAEERQILGGGKINVESLLLLEARPCAGESDAEIVAGAWDFERINRRYARHLKVLAARPGGAL